MPILVEFGRWGGGGGGEEGGTVYQRGSIQYKKYSISKSRMKRSIKEMCKCKCVKDLLKEYVNVQMFKVHMVKW